MALDSNRHTNQLLITLCIFSLQYTLLFTGERKKTVNVNYRTLYLGYV